MPAVPPGDDPAQGCVIARLAGHNCTSISNAQETKKLSLESFQHDIFAAWLPGQARLILHGEIISSQLARIKFCFSSRELEHHHGPPGVDQHDKSKHPDRKPLFIACLLITHTPVLHESLEFILGSFHISKVIHSLISFDYYDEYSGRMSQC